MLNRSLLFAAVILFTVTALEHAPAVWRGAPQMLAALDPETRDWVKALQNKYGASCCDTADGFPVEVDGWDMAGTVDDTSRITQWEAADARSGYRVRLADGKWHDVPNSALIDPKTNKLGYAVVWLLPLGSLGGRRQDWGCAPIPAWRPRLWPAGKRGRAQAEAVVGAASLLQRWLGWALPATPE